MAHLHKKMKKGRPYYYVREIARVDGKPKVVNQVYLGSPERMLELATQGSEPVRQVQVQEFGALWLANLIEQDLRLADLVDSVVPRQKNEQGPTVGEYFLYALFNRLIDARSKRALPDWYKGTAIQQIRPVDIDKLDSQRFWKKWERVSEGQLRTIAGRFFARLAEMEPPSSDCFLFDTTNYFTFMASDTVSELAARGKNKEGRDWLRQVGVALLVSRDNHLPLLYREYEGNRHDSKVFARLLDEVLAAMTVAAGQPGKLTLVFDKGMNAEDNIAMVDSHEQLGFITTYSTYLAEELVQVDRARFQPVETDKNIRLREAGRLDDLLTAWRTTGEYWGQERTVVVTYNPRTATKQRYGFDRKLASLQELLFEMSAKVRKSLPQWRNKEEIERRYTSACADLHLPADLYQVEISKDGNKLSMNFRKNHYRISRHVNRFGKNIILTDNMDWSTDEIVRASLDRYVVEEAFRQTKDDDLVAMMPLRHWTDGKIRCHILTCIVALAYLRVIEIRLKRAGLRMTAKTAMDSMQRLHSCLVWQGQQKKPGRIIEDPDPLQSQILKAFGYEIRKGVLQPAA